MQKIAILLSSFNGEKYIKEQLDSILNQTYKNFILYIRDDFSSDRTKIILKNYMNNEKINITFSKKNFGIKESFNILLKKVLDDKNINYIMFCDQDDIWEEQKIEKTYQKIKLLEKNFKDKPLLVHHDLQVVDHDLNLIAKSFWKYEKRFPQYNDISKLLLQNTVTGCTMMINHSLAKLSYPIPSEAIMHDWWIALVASLFGKIEFINDSLILYRQHELNDTGSQGFNLKYILNKFFKQNILDKNILQTKVFYKRYEDILSEEYKVFFEKFIHINNLNFFEKRFFLVKYGVWKQGIVRNIGLFLKI